MYCVKNEEKWYCVTEDRYYIMYKESEDFRDWRLYKKYGEEYIQTEGGTYESKGTQQRESNQQ